MPFTLEAVFSVDSKAANANLVQLGKEVENWGKKLEAVGKIGAAAAVGAFVALSKGAVDLAGNLADTAFNIGMNVESLQALQAQHQANGVSSEDLSKALTKTKSSVLAAAEGNKEAAAALGKLGLTAKELIRLPLDQQYAAIARGAASAKDENEAFSAIATLLGEKVGPKLMGSLRELGETGLPGVTAAAKKAGHVMSAETIVALDNAGDAIDAFKKKVTIAVGNIIVSFTSEEAFELLGLKIIKSVSQFAGMLGDAIIDGGNMFFAVMNGASQGVVNFLQDGLVEVVHGVASLLNKVLPEKFQINVGNLDQLRSSGRSIGEEITNAVAKTSPSTFKKDIGEAFDSAIVKQQMVVDDLTKKPADALRAAGNQIGKDVTDAAQFEANLKRVATEETRKILGEGVKEDSALFQTKLAEVTKTMRDDIANMVDGIWMPAANTIANAGQVAGNSISGAADKVFNAAAQLSQALTRTGDNYSEQSTAALEGVRARLMSQRDSAQNDTSWSSALMPNGKNPMLSVFLTELTNVERELAARREVQAYAGRYGETAARTQFGDRATDSALREMQSDTRRSTNALERLATGLTAAGIIPRT